MGPSRTHDLISNSRKQTACCQPCSLVMKPLQSAVGQWLFPALVVGKEEKVGEDKAISKLMLSVS